jgi:hypothetical protein
MQRRAGFLLFYFSTFLLFYFSTFSLPGSDLLIEQGTLG